MARQYIAPARPVSGMTAKGVYMQGMAYVKGEERNGYFDVDSLYCLYRSGMDGTQLFAGEIGLDVLHEHARLFYADDLEIPLGKSFRLDHHPGGAVACEFGKTVRGHGRLRA